MAIIQKCTEKLHVHEKVLEQMQLFFEFFVEYHAAKILWDYWLV